MPVANLPHNGLLKAQYEVFCYTCEKASLGLGSSRTGAETQLRKDGWRKKARRWHCDDC